MMTRLLSLLFVAYLAAGCRPHLIPNTDIEDTDEYRAVVEFCETYRHAVEERNVTTLIELAHKDYYEDGGNIDATDDIDRTGLATYLNERFVQSKSIRYEIRYRRISEGRNSEVFVDYTYSASYQLPAEDGDAWRRTVAENRLVLVPNGETFLIKSGM